MSDYHSNDATWDRHDPPDPRYVHCPRCGGQGGRHDDSCGKRRVMVSLGESA